MTFTFLRILNFIELVVNSFCWYYITCRQGLAKGKLAIIHYDSAPRTQRSCFANPVHFTLNLSRGDVLSEEAFFLICNWVFKRHFHCSNGQKIKNAPSKNYKKILNNFSNLSRRQKLSKTDTHNQLCATFRGLCQITSTKYMSSRELGRLKFVSISSSRNWGNSMKYAVQ